MPAKLRFLEDRRTVHGHLEPPAAARLQRDVGVGVLLTNRGRQTDGPGFIVSNGAEFDVESHSEA